MANELREFPMRDLPKGSPVKEPPKGFHFRGVEGFPFRKDFSSGPLRRDLLESFPFTRDTLKGISL